MTRSLTTFERDLLAEARTAVLATIDSMGRPRLVPVCFVALGGDQGTDQPILYTPIDDKPKAAADPHRLARVRDILARPDVSLLVDRWDEDWSRLAWLRLHGRAEILEPSGEVVDGAIQPVGTGGGERAIAIVALRAKYPQYAGHDLESRPLIRVTVNRASSWAATGADPGRVVSDGAAGPRGAD
jgi:PPOX class probable F420-dependent enzyme